MTRKLGVEFLGTFWLVLGGCGAAVLAGQGIGPGGISLAFGLTVLTMAYAVGHVSGAHFNPAVTVGLAAAGRIGWNTVPGYIVAQVLGGIAAALVLYLIVSGKADFAGTGGFASNGFGEHSPGKFSMMSALITEVVLTAMFLVVILGVTHKNAPAGFAPLAIGLCFALIYLITIPVTNGGVNPARSTGPALFAGGVAVEQLWLFWLAPMLGAALAGLANRFTEDNA
jgi:aquaporin Z